MATLTPYDTRRWSALPKALCLAPYVVWALPKTLGKRLGATQDVRHKALCHPQGFISFFRPLTKQLKGI